MLHHQIHPEYVEGCYGCKIASISFATVPGGAKDKRSGVSQLRQRERDLHRYREKRRAGERPDGTTKAAMDRSEHKQDLWARREKDMLDFNSPEAIKKVKRALTNT